MNIRKNLISILSAGALALTAACGLGPDDDGKKGGGSSEKTTCYGATADPDSGLVYTWQEEGSYGVNNLFVHEVEECDDGYCFLNGDKVKNYVKRRGEEIPAAVWRAWRPFAGDGNDPRQFTEEDPFIVGYLPHIPRSYSAWQTKNTTYDWRCEDGDDGETNGLENCIGLNQLDKSFTLNTLRDGKTYLVRFLFGANPNDTGNWIEFCNQAVLEK